MAKPTTSRTTLRRAICRRLGMPFYQRYGTYLTPSTGSNTEKIVDTDLTQQDDSWNNGWVYIQTDTATENIGAIRKIDDFNAADDSLMLEFPLTAAASTGTQYEIITGWSPYEIHDAIDEAQDNAFPSFFNEVEDKTLVVKEDTLEYDLTGLTYRPWIITDIWVERASKSQTGTVTAAATRSLTDTDMNFDSDIDTSWKVSIYDGTGAGQIRTVKSLSSYTINTSTSEADWTTTPDTTSKYRVWDSAEQTVDWHRMIDCHFDQNEYPSTLYLRKRPSNSYGLRIRLNYATTPTSLTADSDETSVPRQYILYKATEILAANKVASSKVDREKYAIMEQLNRMKADEYKEKNFMRLPTTIWIEDDPVIPHSALEEDPMDWK